MMSSKLLIAVLSGAIGASSSATADTITVEVVGIDAPYGRIGCALHSDPDAFPMEQPALPVEWVEVEGPTGICSFENVSPGVYAVAIAHDVNGNNRTDTNFLGIPREEWGVSRNARPSLRAPEFDEASFRFDGDAIVLEIEVD